MAKYKDKDENEESQAAAVGSDPLPSLVLLFSPVIVAQIYRKGIGSAKPSVANGHKLLHCFPAQRYLDKSIFLMHHQLVSRVRFIWQEFRTLTSSHCITEASFRVLGTPEHEAMLIFISMWPVVYTRLHGGTFNRIVFYVPPWKRTKEIARFVVERVALMCIFVYLNIFIL